MTTPLNSYEVLTEGPGIPSGATKIAFSIGAAPFVFSDALLIRSGSMTQAEIDAEIQRRYAEWLAIVSPPADEIPEE